MLFRRLCAALVALSVIAVVPAGRASADPWRPWPGLPDCTEVALSAYDVVGTETGLDYAITGTIRDCKLHQAGGGKWTIATFRTTSAGWAYAEMPYGDVYGPGVTFTFSATLEPDTWAVCVISPIKRLGPFTRDLFGNRVACVGPGEPTGGPTAVPVPTDDPRFAIAAPPVQDPSRPFCGSCV